MRRRDGELVEELSNGQIVDLVQSDFIEKINKMPIVRSPMKAEAVAVRVPKLIGTQVTVTGGRLHEEDLPKFAELCIGAPVMIGHKKDDTPTARVYDAWVKEGWVYAPFYMPMNCSDTADLLAKIDSGVISEVSASFAFETPICSECKSDMRSLLCGHVPGKDGHFFWYDDLKKVLELSLVYRGGHPDTGFVSLMDDPEWSEKFKLIKGGKKRMESLKDDEVKDVKEELMTPCLGALLNRLIEDKSKGDFSPSRLKTITRMAGSSGLGVSDVEEILGSMKMVCPPIDQLKAFAQALDVEETVLIAEAIKDGCKYDIRQTVSAEGVRGYRVMQY